jgi:hypothetical protein
MEMRCRSDRRERVEQVVDRGGVEELRLQIVGQAERLDLLSPQFVEARRRPVVVQPLDDTGGLDEGIGSGIGPCLNSNKFGAICGQAFGLCLR